MHTAARLGLFAAGAAAVFAVALAAAPLIIPADASAAWTSNEEDPMDTAAPGHGGHAGPEASASPTAADDVRGLSVSHRGYALTALTAPAAAGEAGAIAFTLIDGAGEPVTGYEIAHEKPLHLIVVRTDGAEFRHVHPERDADGVWSIDWTWAQAGSYRVFADFAASGADAVTLSRTVQVAGSLTPFDPQPARQAVAAGYDVQLRGDLVAGAASELTVSVTEDGAPVTTLEPYLGAFGHLVALRQGDLGYAHVHPDGAMPQAGDTSGPDVPFTASAPTEGRYLLYFDFQIDGVVHSVPFVVDTTR